MKYVCAFRNNILMETKVNIFHDREQEDNK